jgi:hypothetical protein
MKTKNIKIKMEYSLDLPIDTEISSLPHAGIFLHSKKGKFHVTPTVSASELDSVSYNKSVYPVPSSFSLKELDEEIHSEYFLEMDLVMTIQDGDKIYTGGVLCDA